MADYQKLKLKQFLEKLSNLTKEYDLIISGCGCCGSPNITSQKDDDFIYTHLEWIPKSETYE